MKIKIKENVKVAIVSIIMPYVLGWILFRNKVPMYYLAACYVFVIIGLYSYICEESGEFIYKTAKRVFTFLGKYIAAIALVIVYIIAVMPTGIIMKIVKRDRLRLKKTNLSTYWVDNNEEKAGYEYQF